MNRTGRIFFILFVFAVVILIAGTGCASASKYKTDIFDKKSSCDLSHLGRNKYFYTSHYHRRLTHSTHKIGK